MNQLLHLLKFDFILLNKNKIITISILVTAIYVGVFKGLSYLGNMEKLLILVIFNDPALLGFLFVGVLVLFEKNENTLDALAVTPIKISNYILSKSISLTFLSIGCCLAMVIAAHGIQFHIFHFIMATILTTLIFSMLGFIAVAGLSSFNQYILRALGIILLLSVPFLSYFDVVPRYWFILFPTQPAIDLYSLSFEAKASDNNLLMAYGLCIGWIGITYTWALRAMTKQIMR
jgi:fluoroquinolone transport system permease protein